METLRPFILIVLGIGVFFIASKLENRLIVEVAVAPKIASSIPEKIATSTPPTKVASSTPPQEKPAPIPKITSTPVASTPVTIAPTPPLIPFNDLNIKTRTALVNILCGAAAGSPINGESGSGVFISSKDAILTNAHIAEYFLLQDYPHSGNIECQIRTGSPAVAAYSARLLYISPKWVQNNSAALSQENPQGTGEDDFALLLIKDSVSGAPLPLSFPYLPLREGGNSPVGTPVLVASYPAEFIASESISRNLYAISAISTIRQFFTFTTSSEDVFSVGNIIIAEKGSSGGPVVTQEGTVEGIIVTSTPGATTGERDLFAITISHINQSLKKDIGISIPQLLDSQNLNATADSFEKNVAPALTSLITAHLPK